MGVNSGTSGAADLCLQGPIRVPQRWLSGRASPRGTTKTIVEKQVKHILQRPSNSVSIARMLNNPQCNWQNHEALRLALSMPHIDSNRIPYLFNIFFNDVIMSHRC